MKQTRRIETSKYPEEKKSIEIPIVVASEMGSALNLFYIKYIRKMIWKYQQYRVIVPYSKIYFIKNSKSKTRHVISCLKIGGPSSKAKYS